MGLKFYWTGVMVLTSLLAVNSGAVTKVACVGNSITEGYGIWDKKKYPEHLQDMLGEQYEVKNFGHSSQMFRKKSGESYWNSAKFTAAYEYAPDIVVIELGTNDSKYFFDGKGSSSGYNYMYDPSVKSELLPDYEALIDTFAHQPQAPKIYATLQPYAQNMEWGIVDTAIVNQINPIIKDAATSKGIPLIDLHSTFNKTEWLLDDVVHPNEEGAKELAKIIADAILNGPSAPSEGTSSSSEEPGSSATESAASSATEVSESSSSEGIGSSDAATAESSSATTALQQKVFSNTRISAAGSAVFVENFKGQITVFDMNGNLIKKVHSNGVSQIQMNRSGAFIIKAGSITQKVNLK